MEESGWSRIFLMVYFRIGFCDSKERQVSVFDNPTNIKYIEKVSDLQTFLKTDLMPLFAVHGVEGRPE